jgi:prepilin-type N-terminal cleavage/methylation domain-containing protein
MKKIQSQKGFTLVEIMIVVVIIGLLAAMAIPAFQKVRQSSQEKTLINDARQVASAAAQYYLEQGITEVPFTVLVNTLTSPTERGFVKQLGSGNSFTLSGGSATNMQQGQTFRLQNSSYGTISFDENAQTGTATLTGGGTKVIK